jgi:hypothetical protein
VQLDGLALFGHQREATVVQGVVLFGQARG